MFFLEAWKISVLLFVFFSIHYTWTKNKWMLLLSYLPKVLAFFWLNDWIDRNAYSNIPNSFSNNIMILNFNFQYSKFLFSTERRWRWVQIVVFDSFVWELGWCLTVFDCTGVIFNVPLHSSVSPPTDGGEDRRKP